ncbi:MAG: glycosyltransferase [Anaerolineae bacterium]|nr:glycosyltransferase [Chloroflexota bacterium]
MRILHVYKDYYPVLGGIENHVRLLAERQARAGHEVTVLVTNPGPRTVSMQMAGVQIIKAGRLARVASTPLSLSLPWRLARQRPDITHLHFPYPPAELAQLPHLGARPTVLSYHSDVVRQQRILRFYRPLMMQVLQRVDRVLVASPNYLASSPTLQQVRQRCTVIPYGIDQRPFKSVSAAQVQRLRERHGEGPWVLFVGVLRYYKGLHYLLEALPQMPGRLMLVGEGPEGPALRRQVQATGLEDRVVFAGAVPDEELPAYYALADVFCLPASERSEAFGLVQVEALASGLPIVSTELGTGTSYVNQDGQSGLVVPPRDAAALARALTLLLEDGALRQRLAVGAAARAAAFEAERMVAEMDEVYSAVLAARARGRAR